jgi:flagellar hook assembly protein FlgD
MAQFSALEQMQNMTKSLEGLAASDKYNAVQYVGSTIFFEDEAGQPVYGRVLAVFFDNKEGPVLEIDGYGDVPLYKIDGVTIIV